MSEIGVAVICEIFRGALQVLRVDLLEHGRYPVRLVFTSYLFISFFLISSLSPLLTRTSRNF